MPKKSLYLFIALILTTTLLSACTLPWKKAKQDAANKTGEEKAVVATEEKTDRLKQFSSYTEVSAFLASHKAAPADKWGTKEPAENIAEFKNNPSDLSNSSDTVKYVGDVIYSLVKNELLVLKIESADNTSLLGKMKFPFRPSGLFLEEGALVVYGADEEISESSTYASRQFVRIFDITNPSDPRESRDLAFEGDFSQAFVRGGYLYFLTERNTSKSSESVVPKVFENGKALSNDCSSGEKCFAPSVFYFDSVYNSYRFLNINSISLKTPSEAIGGQAYILNSSQQYLVAGENIYIFHLKSALSEISWQAKKAMVLKRLDEENKKIISEIESAPAYLLSSGEKEVKIAVVIENFINKLSSDEALLLNIEIDEAIASSLNEKGAAAKTIIHKLVPAGSSIDYFASAEANGLVFNALSVADDSDNLYLATKSESLNNTADKKYLSNILIFDKALESVGKLENISTKEDVYGARFIGKRVFLTATNEGSSIFVISLEDKKVPSYVGTLKVPGLYNYLRPMDADGNKFLNLSYEAAAEGSSEKSSSIKLSLYDFSDLKQPKELDSFLIGDTGSDSIVFSDYNSLYYSNTDSVLSVPISFKADGRLNFSGSLIFKITGSSMDLKGRLDHSSGGFYNQPDRIGETTYLENTARRSVFINNVVYSLSNKFLRYSALDTIDTAKSLELSKNDDDMLVSSLTSNSQTSSEQTDGTSSQSGTENPLSDDMTSDTPPSDALLDDAFELVTPPAESGAASGTPAI